MPQILIKAANVYQCTAENSPLQMSFLVLLLSVGGSEQLLKEMPAPFGKMQLYVTRI